MGLKDRLARHPRRVAIGAAALAALGLMVAGVRWQQRRARNAAASAAAAAAPFRPTRDDLPPLGKRNQQSVAEAARLGKPERVSPLVAAPPFDLEAFNRDPEGYLAVVEPARCFQTAPSAGPAPVYLKAMGDLDVEVDPGANAPLIVRGVPNMPVTFTAFGSGTFRENDLSSVTVRADAHGFAMVHPVPPPPGRGDMRVQVGSPVAVGNQVFAVRAVDRTKIN